MGGSSSSVTLKAEKKMDQIHGKKWGPQVPLEIFERGGWYSVGETISVMFVQQREGRG